MNPKTYILAQPHSFVDYILAPLQKDPDVIIHRHSHRKSLGAKIKRFIRSVLPGAHPGLWSRDILSPEYAELISHVRPCDKIIFWAVGNKKDIKIISEDAHTSRLSSLIWDPLRQVCHHSEKEIKEYPGFMRNLGVKVSTFDAADAERHGLNFVGQVYRYPDDTPDAAQPSEEIPVLFIGVEKRRAPELDKVAAALENEGISYKFMILPDKHSSLIGKYPRLEKCVMTEPIPYKEVMHISRDARCLLDILQPGQAGMTMRVLEALFFGKKLITNNVGVKSEPFYRKENIYILDDPRQPWLSIREFLDTPMAHIPDDIVAPYDIANWINKL